MLIDKQLKKEYDKERYPKIKETKKNYDRQWYLKNREKILKKTTEYNKRNIEKIRKYKKKYSILNANKIRDTKREYRKNNVDKIRKYRRFYENNKRKTDIEYRLKKNLRLRVWQILNQKNSSNLRSLKLLGISINKYKIYLEKRFKPGMTWKNYGCKRNQWSIDHIMPCSYFDLTDISQQKKCFHYTNTQPLWHIDNIMKKDKILPKTI